MVKLFSGAIIDFSIIVLGEILELSYHIIQVFDPYKYPITSYKKIYNFNSISVLCEHQIGSFTRHEMFIRVQLCVQGNRKSFT